MATITLTVSSAADPDASFGALTLSGAGGIAVPAGATALTDAGGTNLTVSDGFLVPASNGVTSGTVVFNDGSATSWVITAVANDYSARSLAEIEAAFANAGTTTTRSITVRNEALTGDRLNLNSKTFTGRLTIKSAGRGATIPGVTLTGSSNITLQSLTIRRDFGGSDGQSSGVVEVDNSNALIIEDCDIGSVTAYADMSAATFHGYPNTLLGIVGSSLGTNNATNLTVRGCLIHDVETGVFVNGSDNTIAGNIFRDNYRKFIAVATDYDRLQIIDNIGDGIWARGGSAGQVGPNNPSGTAGVYPYDGNATLGEPHSALLDISTSASTTVDDVVIEGNIFLAGTNRFDALGDYHSFARGPGIDQPTAILDGWRICNNIYGLNGSSDCRHEGLVNSEVSWNTVFRDPATETWNLPYDGGTAAFVPGETVTGGTSGATARILTTGGTSSGTITMHPISGTFLDNEAITSASGAAVVNGTPAPATLTTVMSFGDCDAGNTIRCNVGPYMDTGALNAGLGSVDASIFTNAYLNIPWLGANATIAAAWFDGPTFSGFTVDNVRTRLTPKSGGRLTLEAHEVGAVNSYFTWATGVGTSAYSASSKSFPTVTKPTTGLVNGTALGRVVFDGTNDYAVGTDATDPWFGFTGNAFTMQLGVAMDASDDGQTVYLMDDNATAAVRLLRLSTGEMTFRVSPASDNRLLTISASRKFTSADGYTVWTFTGDWDTGRFFLMRNGEIDGMFRQTFQNAGQWNLNMNALGLAATNAGASKAACQISHFWFDDVFVDLTASGEMAKWIGQDGHPAPLGADGSTPTGASPRIYLQGNAATWNAGHNNGADATDFTMNGAVVDA